MLDRLSSLLSQWMEHPDQAGDDRHGVILAAAVLMVEAATMDGAVQGEERDRIRDILATRFALDEDAAESLLAEAERVDADATQLIPFTRTLKDALDDQQRIDIMEMLWEVAYADGQLHDYESNLVRRVGGLLYVADQDVGAARKRAMARLGLSD
jgi:uncharacterized tellurite resistance protein B-like protein